MDIYSHRDWLGALRVIPFNPHNDPSREILSSFYRGRNSSLGQINHLPKFIQLRSSKAGMHTRSKVQGWSTRMISPSLQVTEQALV